MEIVRRHGADHVVNYREQDFRPVVMELTGGKGVNACYDPVGGERIQRIAPVHGGRGSGSCPSGSPAAQFQTSLRISCW